ncbi:MAG TPA: phosphatase PAP2 family protein [Acidimicrobiia bacterium]
MQVVVVMVVFGVLAALVAGALVWRWPVLAAPRISPRTVFEEAERHPSFGRLLWSRVGAARLSEYALGAALMIAIAGGALLGVVLWMVRSNEGLARYDLSAARFGASHATTGSTDVLRAVSQIGGTVGSIVVAVAVAVIVVAHHRLRLRSVIAFLVVVMVGESLLVALIKAAVDRARPDIDRLTGFSGASFPSGHAATAAATLAAAALLLGSGQDHRCRAGFTALAAGLAVCVAASRVFLGVHWLTDVVAGLALGWVWFAVTSVGFGGRLVRFAEPVEAAEQALATSATPGPHG